MATHPPDSAAAVAARLPAPDLLERRSLAIAALDAAICAEWEFRYFSFDPAWATGERMASMRNGSGDSYHVVFSPAGVVVRGFDHESELSPWQHPDGHLAEGVLDGLPDELRPVIDEPAFRTEGGPVTDLTYCAWWPAGASAWSTGPVADPGRSAERLFAMLLDGIPDGYLEFARDYFEEDPDPTVVAAFFALQPADAALVDALLPDADVDVAAVLEEFVEIGYPIAPTGAVQNP